MRNIRAAWRLPLTALLFLIATSGLVWALEDGNPDTGPQRLSQDCWRFFLCEAETDTGVCQNAAGQQIVLRLTGFQSVDVCLDRSTATAFGADLYRNTQGDPDGATGTKATQTAFGPTALCQSFHWVPDAIWMNVTSVSGGAVTAIADVCRD